MHTHITHVVGARPNFVKAAPVVRALAALGHRQRIVHTGQHYDDRMSEVFFGELGLPVPDVNLGVGSGSAKLAVETDALVLPRVPTSCCRFAAPFSTSSWTLSSGSGTPTSGSNTLHHYL